MPGVNVPSVRNIVFFRYVQSPILFHQMVGRGTRIDEESGKLKKGDTLSGDVAFKLHDTYGFPYELTKELLAEEGLAVLESPWDPPAGPFDRARGALAAADLPRMTIQRNHLTDPTGSHQIRYGHDGRWYPYRAEPHTGPADWWPDGPADEDPVGALTSLLGA